MKRIVLFMLVVGLLLGGSCRKSPNDIVLNAPEDIILTEMAIEIVDACEPVAEPIRYAPGKKYLTGSGQSTEMGCYYYEVGSWAMDGECLHVIADKIYGDPKLYGVLYQVNSDIIDDPNVIFEGMVLRIPEEIYWEEGR